MLDTVRSRRLFYRFVFAALLFGLIFIKLLPLATAPTRFPAPDLLFVFTAVWLMRRPNYVPVWLVAVVFLLADFLFMRPPGLWTAISLIAFEVLRKRRLGTTEIQWPIEIVLVAGIFAVSQVVYMLAMAIVFVPRPDAGVVALHILTTAAAYPFAILVTRFIFGIKRARPGDMDEDKATA